MSQIDLYELVRQGLARQRIITPVTPQKRPPMRQIRPEVATPHIRMQISPWSRDEHGNPTRTIRAVE
jgi:hypothetical protein